ncbi:MAG: hypothetical protein ISR47_05140 [Rhodospirillales bacterium]|nr:hypothetical protein [Rhodospirillales bacterium]
MGKPPTNGSGKEPEDTGSRSSEDRRTGSDRRTGDQRRAGGERRSGLGFRPDPDRRNGLAPGTDGAMDRRKPSDRRNTDGT